MSRYVDMLVKSIKDHPSNWFVGDYAGHLVCGEVEIGGIGNTKLLSVCYISCKGVDVVMTYTDRYKIEGAVLWWYKNCSLLDIVGGSAHG